MEKQETVRRLVDEAVNGGRDEVIEELFAFKGNRIASLWGVEDTLDRFQQLGLDPSA